MSTEPKPESEPYIPVVCNDCNAELCAVCGSCPCMDDHFVCLRSKHWMYPGQ